MAADWFYKIGDQLHGPVPPAELRRKADAGEVGPETLVRKGVDGPWMPAKKVRGLFRQSDSPLAIAGRQGEGKPIRGTAPPPIKPLPMPPPGPATIPPVEWSYRIGDQVQGPVSHVELQRKAIAGEIGPETLVRNGNQPWGRAATLSFLAAAFGSSQRTSRGSNANGRRVVLRIHILGWILYFILGTGYDTICYWQRHDAIYLAAVLRISAENFVMGAIWPIGILCRINQADFERGNPYGGRIEWQRQADIEELQELAKYAKSDNVRQKGRADAPSAGSGLHGGRVRIRK